MCILLCGSAGHQRVTSRQGGASLQGATNILIEDSWSQLTRLQRRNNENRNSSTTLSTGRSCLGGEVAWPPSSRDSRLPNKPFVDHLSPTLPSVSHSLQLRKVLRKSENIKRKCYLKTKQNKQKNTLSGLNTQNGIGNPD